MSAHARLAFSSFTNPGDHSTAGEDVRTGKEVGNEVGLRVVTSLGGWVG
jgi:hypothetical protein